MKTTCFLADMNDFQAFNGVYAQYFPSDPPARSTIQSARLPGDMKVEVEVVALLERQGRLSAPAGEGRAAGCSPPECPRLRVGARWPVPGRLRKGGRAGPAGPDSGAWRTVATPRPRADSDGLVWEVQPVGQEEDPACFDGG